MGWMMIVATLICSAAHGFYDAELEEVWKSVSNIYHPTLHDYQLFENYLSTARRSYLDYFRSETNPKFQRLFDFKFVGEYGEVPIFEKHAFNVNENDMERCILLYSSYNGVYPKKTRKLLAEIEESGYRGHVLVRIGGFPNVANGGLKICHVPYAFKIAFFREAQLRGYKNVLWIDSAIHPLTEFSFTFKHIQDNGYFFTAVATLKDHAPSHNPKAAESLGINESFYEKIYHISTSIVGFNMENKVATQFLDEWYQETERVYPCITLYPEEVAFAVIAWRLKCIPPYSFYHVVCQGKDFEILDRPIADFVKERELNYFLDYQR